MCLQERPLQDSHFIPARVYRYCREGNFSPLRVGLGHIFPTDRQTTDYLLCKSCEDVLNKGGESWILDKLATWERTFPLYDLLTQAPPILNEAGSAVYLTAQNKSIAVEKVTHFALGIFWKASVHPWRGDIQEPRIELGPYSESIRKWLLDETAFPEYVYLHVIVERPERAQISINDPYEGVCQGWRTHFFHVPGILFMLALGKTVDSPVRSLAINNAGNPITVLDEITDKFENMMVTYSMNAEKTRAFFKAKAKAEKYLKRR